MLESYEKRGKVFWIDCQHPLTIFDGFRKIVLLLVGNHHALHDELFDIVVGTPIVLLQK